MSAISTINSVVVVPVETPKDDVRDLTIRANKAYINHANERYLEARKPKSLQGIAGIGNSGAGENTDKVTEEAIRELARNTPKLTSINFSQPIGSSWDYWDYLD